MCHFYITEINVNHVHNSTWVFKVHICVNLVFGFELVSSCEDVIKFPWQVKQETWKMEVMRVSKCIHVNTLKAVIFRYAFLSNLFLFPRTEGDLYSSSPP